MHADATATVSLPPDMTSFSIEAPYERNRLTSFFRFFTALPHLIFLALYSIVALFAIIGAWFAIVFTAKYPAGLYGFVERFVRYSSRVNSYLYLATDSFPPFDGKIEHPYEAVFLLGPPKERYSRPKTFFRGILVFPYAIAAYVLSTVVQNIVGLAWLVILFMGHQPNGVQKILTISLSFQIRLSAWMCFLTEAWPTIDDPLSEGMPELAATAQPAPTEPPPPPAPPTPPAVPDMPS